MSILTFCLYPPSSLLTLSPSTDHLGRLPLGSSFLSLLPSRKRGQKRLFFKKSGSILSRASDGSTGSVAKDTREDAGAQTLSEEARPVDEEEWVNGSSSVKDESFSGNSKGGGRTVVVSTLTDSLSLSIKEPVYEVIEVRPDGIMSTKNISRRQLLKSSGLRPRDIRSVDPSLWLTNSMPSLLVREHAILLNLGSLRAIAMPERVLVFDHNRIGGKNFLESLLPRLNPKNVNGAPSMPFELEVVEAALISRIQRLEQRLMDVEPRVVELLEILPNRLTADALEQLRLSKQKLVDVGSRAGDLKQMLLDLLEDPLEIRRICIMGRKCSIRKENNNVECSLSVDKQIAEEEEEEIEMLLENYLQRCESCHGQAERLLDSAKEMEDSIAVNLSSRRLEVSRVEVLLQVGTFCIAVGALVAVCLLVNYRWYIHWRGDWILSHVFISQGKKDIIIISTY